MKTAISLAEKLCELRKRYDRSFVVGINGAQGSGKSTLARQLAKILANDFQQQVVTFSLDDFYKSKADRQALAESVHPLFITRGVPGTHDLDVALLVLNDLVAGRPTKIPVFDKALDDRVPDDKWQIVSDRVDVVIFEGWCVGAKPQADTELAKPINSLEMNEDSDGVWRCAANQYLEDYQVLFSLIDFLIMMQVRDFNSVFENRMRQERELGELTNKVVMSEAETKRFIQHYQRLTEFMLTEMPTQADLVLPAFQSFD